MNNVQNILKRLRRLENEVAAQKSKKHFLFEIEGSLFASKNSFDQFSEDPREFIPVNEIEGLNDIDQYTKIQIEKGDIGL